MAIVETNPQSSKTLGEKTDSKGSGIEKTIFETGEKIGYAATIAWLPSLLLSGSFSEGDLASLCAGLPTPLNTLSMVLPAAVCLLLCFVFGFVLMLSANRIATKSHFFRLWVVAVVCTVVSLAVTSFRGACPFVARTARRALCNLAPRSKRRDYLRPVVKRIAHAQHRLHRRVFWRYVLKQPSYELLFSSELLFIGHVDKRAGSALRRHRAQRFGRVCRSEPDGRSVAFAALACMRTSNTGVSLMPRGHTRRALMPRCPALFVSAARILASRTRAARTPASRRLAPHGRTRRRSPMPLCRRILTASLLLFASLLHAFIVA